MTPIRRSAPDIDIISPGAEKLRAFSYLRFEGLAMNELEEAVQDMELEAAELDHMDDLGDGE